MLGPCRQTGSAQGGPLGRASGSRRASSNCLPTCRWSGSGDHRRPGGRTAATGTHASQWR